MFEPVRSAPSTTNGRATRGGDGVRLGGCGVALGEARNLRVVFRHRALVAIAQRARVIARQLAESIERVLPFAQLRFARRPVRRAFLARLFDLLAQRFGLQLRLFERCGLLRKLLLPLFEHGATRLALTDHQVLGAEIQRPSPNP